MQLDRDISLGTGRRRDGRRGARKDGIFITGVIEANTSVMKGCGTLLYTRASTGTCLAGCPGAGSTQALSWMDRLMTFCV